jgi:hypothetical protein
MTERGKRWLSFLGVLLHRRPLLGHEPKVVAQAGPARTFITIS